MKRLTSTRLCSRLLAVVALSCFGVGAAYAAPRSSTAQSLQFVLTAGTNYVIEGTEAWKYEDAVAATNFTNQVTGGPTLVRCSGSSTNCATGNAPSPTLADAPAADDQKLADVVRDNKCNFWSGTTLTGTTYTKQKTFNGQNGGGNWVYSYSYTIAPIQTSYPAKTAWILQDSNTTFPSVSVDGFLAGQSTVLKTAGTRPWDFKASHTMLNADSTPRLDATLTLTNNATSETVGQVDLLLDTNYEIESGVTWNYQATPGLIFGDSQQLFTGEVDGLLADPQTEGIQDGGISAPNGRKDTFAGNDGTGGERAVFSDLEVAQLVEPGSYTLSLTGTLKGNEGNKDAGISASEQIDVSAQGCQ